MATTTMIRLLLAVMLCTMALPAFPYYFVAKIEAAYDLPSIEGDRFRSGTVVIREEPCSRPAAAIALDIWVFVRPYSPTELLQWGYKLASTELPRPRVLPDGACETRYTPDQAGVIVAAPPTGLYNVAYFVRVTPSLGCPQQEPECYEDVGTSNYLTAAQRVAVPYRPDARVPHVYSWRETLRVVEYFHPELNHYFLTAWPAEIEALDRGATPGWQRTGETFDVWTSGSFYRSRVCRFYGVTAGKGTHFYTSHQGECTALMNQGAWQYESVLGYVQLPGTLGCVLAPRALYRLYNAGMGGSPNHRYTTSLAIRSDMISNGWISEGYGDLGVIGCIP